MGVQAEPPALSPVQATVDEAKRRRWAGDHVATVRDGVRVFGGLGFEAGTPKAGELLIGLDLGLVAAHARRPRKQRKHEGQPGDGPHSR